MAENSGADGFAPLRVKRVVRETSDAVSLVLDVPECCSARYRYQAGQFLTLRVTVDGQDLRRCYSMSSAPLEDDLQITIKRDPGGVVSNWLNDTVSEGIEIHAAPPEGRFCLRDTTDEIVAFAGGSGITPIMSLVRTALASSSRRIRVFYANRCRDSVIFADALTRLADEHADRLVVVHHIDDDSGVVTPPVVESFVADTGAADYYICGPGPFMDTVEATVLESGIPRERVHLERFSVEPAACRCRRLFRADRRSGDRTRSHDHHRRLPGGQHVAADGAHRRPAGTVVMRDRFVRDVYGARCLR